MITCPQAESITVSAVDCSLLTPSDWLTNPGNCRLRIKNFNATDWLSGGCGACANAGGTTWDGTFPVFTAGPPALYQIDPSVGNIGGKAPLFGPNCAVGVFAGTDWYLALACNPSYIFASDFHPIAGGPLVTYSRSQGCVLTASFQIEAYSL